MSEEEITLVNAPASGTADPFSKVMLELPDNDPVVQALNLKSGNPEAEQKTEAQNVEPQAEPKVEPQSVTPPQADGTVKPEVKPDKVPYTEDELKALLADSNATLDTSRLDERGQAIHKEFQRGYTKKFEELKREREEVERRRAEIAAFEERQRQLEAERKYREDVEQLGEDEANRLKELREIKGQLAQLTAERQAFQQREAASMFRQEFVRIAPSYNVPTSQEMEDLAMSYLWANNQVRSANGQPLLTMEDGVRIVADQLGISNMAQLEKIISANPKNKEAYEQKIIADYLKKKAAGANVPSSSQAAVPDKPSEKEIAVDMAAFQKDPSAALLERVNRRLEEANLRIK